MYTTGHSSIKRISFPPYGSSTTRFGQRQGQTNQAYSLKSGLYDLLGGLCASDLSEISEESLRKGINRIIYRFLLDLSLTRSDIETGEILQRCQIGRINLFSKTVLPGSNFLRGGEFSLSEVFFAFLRDAIRYIG